MVGNNSSLTAYEYHFLFVLDFPHVIFSMFASLSQPMYVYLGLFFSLSVRIKDIFISINFIYYSICYASDIHSQHKNYFKETFNLFISFTYFFIISFVYFMKQHALVLNLLVGKVHTVISWMLSLLCIKNGNYTHACARHIRAKCKPKYLRFPCFATQFTIF